MSTPTHQQSRLSLQLRKRNLERTEDGLPPKKHAKQIEATSLIQQKQKNVTAFGAPILEERKVAKRGNNEETTKFQDGAPKKKRDTRQATLQQFLSSSVSVPEKDSTTKVIETTTITTEASSELLPKETINLEEDEQQQSDDLPTVDTTSEEEQQQPADLPTKDTTSEEEQQQPADLPTKKTITEEQSSPDILNSPSASPSVEPTSNKNESEPLDSPIELTSLPSPSSTPKNDRTKALEKPSSSLSIVHGKSLLVKLDKERIDEERTTLDKLVSALDITLTFHAARNVAAFFHKIQPMLRNSTKKNVTISHLCQILHVAPELYQVETKLLKEYGKDVEAHQVSIGHDWPMPLSGKMIQERKDLMTKRSGDYYEQHKEANARIPEKELPRLDKVVDKKKWLQNANLPDRVRSVLELQEKRKAAKEEKAAQPRVEPVGTAKDRAKALLERIRNKQKK